MKKTLLTLITVGVLALSTTTVSLSSMEPIGSDPPPPSIGFEPVCVDPCDPPIYNTNFLPHMCITEMDGTQEILGVTQDGYYIIKYKGKIYIFHPAQ